MPESLFAKSRDELDRLRVDMTIRLSEMKTILREAELEETRRNLLPTPERRVEERRVPRAIPIRSRSVSKRNRTSCAIQTEWTFTNANWKSGESRFGRSSESDISASSNSLTTHRIEFNHNLSDLRRRIALLRESRRELDRPVSSPTTSKSANYR